MKLYKSLVSKIIDIPAETTEDLRHLLDSVGLEVKGITETKGDVIFDIETLANRGDHLHHLGVAREISGRTLSHLHYPKLASELPSKSPSIKFRRETPKCLVYGLLELEISSNFQAPQEVATYIENKAGRHPIVDVMNYVQLEIGQPMHAFDKDSIEGEIIIEESKKEETVEALDGKTYKVPAGSLLIKDQKKIIAVAGVIGCANSMCTSKTTRTLIESATFDPILVRKTAKKMGISTDASYVFERGADPELPEIALKRVVALTSSMSSVSAKPIGFLLTSESIKSSTISISLKFIRDQMNLPRLSETEISSRLKCLGFKNEFADKNFIVSVPSHRMWDIATSEDIMEEVSRSFGLNHVKLELPPLDPTTPPLNIVDEVYEKAGSALQGSGFTEVITRNFLAPRFFKTLEELSPKTAKDIVRLQNSIEADYGALKPTNVFHLAACCAENLKNGVTSVKVFEVGRVFRLEQIKHSPYRYETEMLTFAQTGRWFSGEWKTEEPIQERARLFAGIAEVILGSYGRGLEFKAGAHPLLHPSAQALIVVGKTEVGHVGLIHPKIQALIECRDDILYGEFSVDLLSKLSEHPQYLPPSEFPSIKRDFTLSIKPLERAGVILEQINKANPKELASMYLINDFKKPDEDFRRVSVRLVFQSHDRTLSSEEVDATCQEVIEHLRKTGIQLVA